MPATAARSGSAGEFISHYTAVRMRITGTGVLRMRMHSLDNVFVKDLKSLVIEPTTNREPTRLMNFMQQRAALSCNVSELDEFFRINRIILFTKATFTSYPG